MWAHIQALRKNGVMGLNKRNAHYIGSYNERRLYPLVDDKLKTKVMAQDAGVHVPGLIGTIRYQHDARDFATHVDGHQGFVIKPCKGSGGKGILVITARDGDTYIKSNGTQVTARDVRRHISNVLGGLFSLGGNPDMAMIESLIRFDPTLQKYSYEGVPDIRLIVFQGFPVMAMMRLATHESDGRANLHQGAVGVGLDLATGKALSAVQYNHPIDTHPDTGAKFSEIAVPSWEAVLELSAKCYDMTGLGYLGADIVLDERQGPLLLELNARPGLAIQIANQTGLLTRLRQIEDGKVPKSASAAERALYAREHLASIDQTITA